jgi:hypothetical protein
MDFFSCENALPIVNNKRTEISKKINAMAASKKSIKK